MSDDAKEKALKGEWTYFTKARFEITETMTMDFEGMSCIIVDAEGNSMGGHIDTKVEDEVVHKGYRVDVLYGNVAFKKS